MAKCKDPVVSTMPQQQSGLAVGGLAITVFIAAAVTAVANSTAKVLNSIAREVRLYAQDLVDSSASRFADHQPRIHHVIPRGEFSHYGPDTTKKVREMQDMLEKAGIKIDSTENLVVISHGTHKSIHTKHYIDTIYDIMMWAKDDKAKVRGALFLARQYAASLDRYPMGTN